MDVKDLVKHYNTYYYLARSAGLWPFDDSMFAKVQRTIFCVLTLGCIIIQYTTLIYSEFTMKNLLSTLCFSGLLLLLLLRYLGFMYCFSVAKFIYRSIENDCITLKNPVETEILTNHLNTSRRIILIYIMVGFSGTFFGVAILICAMLLTYLAHFDEIQLPFLNALGFHVQQTKHANWVTVLAIVETVVGTLMMSCIESSFVFVTYYIRGLFKITSYRICNAIDIAANRVVSKNNLTSKDCIREAMDFHKKSINVVTVLITENALPYLSLLLVVVLSFPINLYRFTLAIAERNNLLEFGISSLLVGGHLFFIFINNHNCQIIIDSSIDVFYKTCDSVWYCAPISIQKLLLIVVHRSSIQCSFNLFNIVAPSYEGFSAVMINVLSCISDYTHRCHIKSIYVLDTEFIFLVLLYTIFNTVVRSAAVIVTVFV
ncbi:uncharacterized protein LOC143150429 [Ptiloglossa arizonensis]|uniref:uncharacterized protein LOC143150429 n=1 Tax=Ptiloglossa arizonensis TaxID=3350558 RepID=UPI003FA15914